MKYLYGAAVQGIQNFIFQTNELKDIVGASELVENICTILFKESVDNYKDSNAIINAAGNIKYEFDNIEDCKALVRKFPKTVLEYAPGVTISQAVVEIENDDDFAAKVDILEEKLRAQRNKPLASTTIGLMGILRSRKTGLPVVETELTKEKKLEYLDAATLAKRYEVENGMKSKRLDTLKLPRVAFDNDHLRFGDVALNIEDMTDKNDWVAIIHADGNGLGQVVQKIGKNKKSFREFSLNLDAATKKSAREAYIEINKRYGGSWSAKPIPIRPIVLGGDDLTVVCRADIAIEFVVYFMERFEKNTEFECLKGVFLGDDQKLTACAGIAYIKSSYPFYYGYNLAEALCTRAKKDAKAGLKKEGDKTELPPSCLMFHKVQDSFVESFDEIAKRELQPQKNVSFEFGPYYINVEEVHGKSRWKVKKLLDNARLLDGGGLKDESKSNAVKSHLRNWLSLLHTNPGMAQQKLVRLQELLDTSNSDDKKLLEFVKEITKTEERCIKTPAYDILAIHTINTQDTRSKEDE